jgi:signal peptidase I
MNTPTVTQLVIILAALAAFGVVLCVAGCKSVVQTPPMPNEKKPTLGIVGATGSMRPAYDFADLVDLEPVPFADLKVGDVVLRRIGAYREVMHRIVYIGVAGNGGTFMVTKGDNVPKPDPSFMDEGDYLGRIKLIRKAGN